MLMNALKERLETNPFRQGLTEHEFFRLVKIGPLDKDQVAVFLGQWWHPLHYFPTFLARSVSVLPTVDLKCAISKILYQEAGEGDPDRAHEVIYLNTMKNVGFPDAEVSGAAPFPETKELVAGYEKASTNSLSALGFIFATEVADLIMVSGIGTAVRRVTGESNLEWVNVHITQEPDHVDEANNTLTPSYNEREEAVISQNAELMWKLWIGFFDRLEAAVFGSAALESKSEEKALRVSAQ